MQENFSGNEIYEKKVEIHIERLQNQWRFFFSEFIINPAVKKIQKFRNKLM